MNLQDPSKNGSSTSAADHARLLEAQALAGLGSWEWNVTNDAVTWSDNLYHLFGIEREDFHPTLTGYLDLIHPLDRARVEAVARAAPENGLDYQVEHRIIRGDGTIRWIESRGRAVKDDDEVQLHGTALDITEVVQSRNALARTVAIRELRSEITRSINTSVDPVETLGTALQGLTHYVGAALGHGYLLDEHKTAVESSVWCTGSEYEEEDFRAFIDRPLDLHGFSVPTETFRSQQPLYVDDLSLHSEYPRSRVAREAGIKATLAAGIRLGTDAVGALEFFFESDEAIEKKIILLVEGVAIELGRAIERDRDKTALITAATTLKREREFLEAVFDNLQDGVVACDADGVITVFNQASRLLHERSEATVPTGDWTKEFDLYQADLKTPMQIEDIPLNLALSGEVVKNAEFAIVPKSGKPRIVSSNGQAMFGDDGEKLGAVITLHDLTEQREAAGRLAHSSLHDPLTDLGNRSLFMERLTEAARRQEGGGSGLAAVIIDIDDFSLINEKFGHEAADQVLILLADRLRSAAKDAGLIARTGADEFAILCEKVADEADAERLAEKLLHELQLPLSVRGRDLTVRACVGIALATQPNHPEEIMRDAELALRGAKHLGKNQVQVLTDVMRGEALERDRTKKALGRALSNGEFVLAYQPKILLETNQIVGVEALLRWKDPERGNIPPLDFIPLAEETGLIVPIGAWVIDEACAQIARWSAQFPWHVAPKVCVNVSGSQFHDGLVETVRQALSASGIDPSLLVLELTESILIEDISVTLTKLHELKELGVSLSIDDFGTGYSSLAYLKRFPIDEVKIDRSFIDGLGENPEDTAIVAAIMGMAHALDLIVIAEGVENLEQLAALKTLGCEIAQGFYFSRPEPAEKITNLLLAQSGGHTLRPALPGENSTKLQHNTVLVVDDAEDVLQLSRASLSSVGFNVLEAKTGTEAISIARKANPGCIVLDLTLPDMSGLDVCATLRRDPLFEECTIVMLTAHTSSEDKASAFSLGADDYMVKPFAPRDLVSRVRVAMERRASSLAR